MTETGTIPATHGAYARALRHAGCTGRSRPPRVTDVTETGTIPATHGVDAGAFHHAGGSDTVAGADGRTSEPRVAGIVPVSVTSASVSL